MESVIYNGKSILKTHFRVFLFNKDGNKILVNNWDEYESLIKTGEWSDTAFPPIEYEDKNNKKLGNRKKIQPSIKDGKRVIQGDVYEITLV